MRGSLADAERDRGVGGPEWAAQAPDEQVFAVLDVESIGLFGESFWWGIVVVDRRGNEVLSDSQICRPGYCAGTDEGRAWVLQNCPLPTKYEPIGASEIRTRFAVCWAGLKERWPDVTMWADCSWPVEARFLRDVYLCNPGFEGPYPLHDVATLRFAAGFDPLATNERMENELPAHSPVCDARQSARLLIEALDRLPEHQLT